MISNSSPYAIGLLAALMLLAMLVRVFDNGQFCDTFKAYWIHSGIFSAIAWAVLFAIGVSK